MAAAYPHNLRSALVASFTLSMQGGRKGLIVNSTNLCAGANRAAANIRGQNGRRYSTRPKLVAVNCKKAHKKGKRAKRR